MKFFFNAFIMASILILANCTTINSSIQIVPAQARWGISPFINNTEVPQAGYRGMDITAGLLEARGVTRLAVYKSNANCNQLIACPNANPSVGQLLKWARHHHLNYVMTGAVNEWGYKVGLDGEPVASVTLQLYEVKGGQMIWSSVGSKFGTSRAGLGITAQVLISDMLSALKIV